MRILRLSVILMFPLAVLALLILALGQPTQAAPAAQTAALPGDTLIPMGVAQPGVRDAYRAVLEHLYAGGRVHFGC